MELRNGKIIGTESNNNGSNNKSLSYIDDYYNNLRNKELKNGKVLSNHNEYRNPIYDIYSNELVGYEYIDGRRPQLNDVYIGFYDLAPKCLRGLKWECYGIQGWHICVQDD